MDTEFVKVESPNYEDGGSTLVTPGAAKLRNVLICGRPQLKKRHVCPHDNCGAVFSKPSRLKIHLNIHTGKHPFKCAAMGCEKAYFKATSLRRHVLVHHTDSVLPKALVPCSYPGCHKSLSSVSSLKKHLFRHLNSTKKREQKPIRCPHCASIFERLCDFNRHMRGHRTYICDIEKCGQLFQRRAHLRTHIATYHPADYICSECNKKYKSKSKLKVHLISHMNEEEKRKLYCPFENCTRAYYHKQNLNHHIKTAHEGKKYECPLCNKSLTTKKILERHMSVHETLLDQPCNKIDVTFSPVHKYPYIVDSIEKSLQQQEMLHKSLISHRPASNEINSAMDPNDNSLDEYTLDAPESTLEPEVNLEESSCNHFESDIVGANTKANFKSQHEVPNTPSACEQEQNTKVGSDQYILPADTEEAQTTNQKTAELLDSVKQEWGDHFGTSPKVNMSTGRDSQTTQQVEVDPKCS